MPARTNPVLENASLIKVGSVLFKVIALIVLSIAGVWIAGIITGQWFRLEVSGAFVKWKMLDGPQKFQKIVNVQDFELRAQAENGKVYSYTTEWKEWQPDPNHVDRGFNDISTDCEDLYWFHAASPRYPPQGAGTPVQCGVVNTHHPTAGTVDEAYYVLLDDGSIWMWRHTRDPQQEIITFFGGLLIGLIAGIITWFLIQRRL